MLIVTSPGNEEGKGGGGERRIDEVCNLGTMFSQLAKRSTRMLVSSTFMVQVQVIVRDVLTIFRRSGMFSSSDELHDVGIKLQLKLYSIEHD